MKQGFWADLFTTVCNCRWELARFLAALAFLAVIALAAHKTLTGQDVPLKDLSGALMDVLIGSGIAISAKDLARYYSLKGAEQP